ncbi:MAG: hypothetical protein OEV89_04910 [Desulfobulbaceae bacterium]|nr:hypothetical protein [Desulfobulbaceae bacterium]HIJ90089.1 hypothetical protein [Deltaproteobacteria bacterium]
MDNPTPQDLRTALKDGTIYSVDSETLKQYLVLLSQGSGAWSSENIYNPLVGNIINHILMQRHIDRLNKQNSITQSLVIVLTIAALLVAIPQIWFAYKADKRAETVPETQSMPQSENKLQMSTPIPGSLPANHQVESPGVDVKAKKKSEKVSLQ